MSFEFCYILVVCPDPVGPGEIGEIVAEGLLFGCFEVYVLETAVKDSRFIVCFDKLQLPSIGSFFSILTSSLVLICCQSPRKNQAF